MFRMVRHNFNVHEIFNILRGTSTFVMCSLCNWLIYEWHESKSELLSVNDVEFIRYQLGEIVLLFNISNKHFNLFHFPIYTQSRQIRSAEVNFFFVTTEYSLSVYNLTFIIWINKRMRIPLFFSLVQKQKTKKSIYLQKREDIVESTLEFTAVDETVLFTCHSITE